MIPTFLFFWRRWGTQAGSVSVRGPAVALPGRSSQTTLLPRLNVVAVPGRPNTATLLSRSDQ